MHTLVLQRSSISVKLESKHLVVRDHARPDSEPTLVPLATIDRVIIHGQPAISFPALAKIMDLHIPCTFLSAQGRWRGMVDDDQGYHANRRMRQYDSQRNADFALSFSKRIIVSKLQNCRRTLQRLSANRKIPASTLAGYAELSCGIQQLSTAETLNALRGIEGRCAACYFQALATFFPADIPFESRSRRPPRNAANALLSFLYTLVASDVASAVRAHGLDVSAGYFHCGYDRAPALALDLMEPFRPLVADRIALDLLNHRRILAAIHFEPHEDGGIYLNEIGRALVFRAYDEALRRRCETSCGKLTMRQQMDKVVCGFLKLLDQEPNDAIRLSA